MAPEGRVPEGWPALERDAIAHVFVAALDDTCDIEGADGHHLQRVRRVRPGEILTAADGAGSWRRYQVDAGANGRLTLVARGVVHREPDPSSTVGLALALTKGGALENVAARCTELGVARIEPIRTERSVVRWDAARAAAAHRRLQDVAREAAMQCRRARLPHVAPVAELASLVGRPGLVIAALGGDPPAALPPPPESGWTVLVGPEGGLTEAELDQLGPCPRLSLAPYVLRVETAPIVASALLMDLPPLNS